MVRVIDGFHGTSQENAERILEEGFQESTNEDDWLGRGVYFFQDAPGTARKWAARRFGENGAVLHSEIELVDCLDLLDDDWHDAVRLGFKSYHYMVKEARKIVPRNEGSKHFLDCEVVNHTCDILERHFGTKVRSIRAAFGGWKPIFDGSALMVHAHVQMSVRDPTVILSTRLISLAEI